MVSILLNQSLPEYYWLEWKTLTNIKTLYENLETTYEQLRTMSL